MCEFRCDAGRSGCFHGPRKNIFQQVLGAYATSDLKFLGQGTNGVIRKTFEPSASRVQDLLIRNDWDSPPFSRYDLRVVPSHTNSASPSTTTSSEILLWDRKKQIRFWELRQNRQLLSLGASVEFHECITGQIAGRFAVRKIRPETNRLFFVCLSPFRLSHRIRCFGNISFHNFYIFMVNFGFVWCYHRGSAEGEKKAHDGEQFGAEKKLIYLSVKQRTCDVGSSERFRFFRRCRLSHRSRKSNAIHLKW